MLSTNNISAILASQMDLSIPSLTSTLKSEDSKEVVSHDHGFGSCELKESVDKLRIAMEKLGRWGSYGSDRKHQAFHGAATTHCHTHTHHSGATPHSDTQPQPQLQLLPQEHS